MFSGPGRWPLFTFGLIVSLLVTSCNQAPPVTAGNINTLIEANTAFAVDLYDKLNDVPGNVFCSPYSVSTLLTLTYLGTQDQARDEINKLSRNTLPPNEFVALSGRLLSKYERLPSDGHTVLISASCLWYQSNYPLQPKFVQSAKLDLRTDVKAVDFHNAATAPAINAWAGDKIKPKLPPLLDPAQLTNATHLVIGNVTFFQSRWEHPFSVEATADGPFAISTNETVTVPMMHQTGHFKLLEIPVDPHELAVQLVELPYTGSSLSLIIILPDIHGLTPEEIDDALPKVEQKLTVENLQTWITTLQQQPPTNLVLSLPRFTAAQSYDLGDTLKALGMPSAFTSTANFSGLNGKRDLFLDHMFHQASMTVKENDIEGSVTRPSTLPTLSPTNSFIADHPFTYLLRENSTGSILFMGRLVNPAKP